MRSEAHCAARTVSGQDGICTCACLSFACTYRARNRALGYGRAYHHVLCAGVGSHARDAFDFTDLLLDGALTVAAWASPQQSKKRIFGEPARHVAAETVRTPFGRVICKKEQRRQNKGMRRTKLAHHGDHTHMTFLGPSLSFWSSRAPASCRGCCRDRHFCAIFSFAASRESTRSPSLYRSLPQRHLFFRPMGRASVVGAHSWGTPVEAAAYLHIAN